MRRRSKPTMTTYGNEDRTEVKLIAGKHHRLRAIDTLRVRATIIQMGRILAIDYGTKRIGLAVSDPTRTIASGLVSIPMSTTAARTIATLAAEREVDCIILGHPLSLKGNETQRSQEVIAFKAELEQATGLKVELVDERFTTNLARQYLGETHRRVRSNKQPVDIVAATILLEDYLQRGQE